MPGRVGIGGEVEVALIERQEEVEVALTEEEVAERLVPGDAVLRKSGEAEDEDEGGEPQRARSNASITTGVVCTTPSFE